MTRNLLPPTLSSAPHVAAFEDLFENRLGGLPMDSTLVYLIDTVDSALLPYLAEQFDVLGFKGYKLATTDAERRGIIKKAIELKRHMGTVWAIREALSSVGFGSEAVIVEGVGTSGIPAQDWAVFRIEIDLGSSKGVSGSSEDEATRLINEYKNARSFLESISYKSTMSETLDTLSESEEVSLDAGEETDTLSYGVRYYDGTWPCDGSINYDEGTNELITLFIL